MGEVPEGWIQAYGPASIVEILHNGIPTEVELIEPLLLDPFGSATFQFWTDLAGLTDAGCLWGVQAHASVGIHDRRDRKPDHGHALAVFGKLRGIGGNYLRLSR